MTLGATEYTSLIRLADRMWEVAWAIDALRDDTEASEWTAFKVRDLWRQGRADDKRELLPLLAVLERRLELERSGRRSGLRRETETVPV